MIRNRFFFRFRIHPLFLILLVASTLFGFGMQWVVLFALVLLHELGHVMMAIVLGYQIREVEILPYGGVAKLEHGSLGWNPRHEVWIAIAGPSVNFLFIFALSIMNLYLGRTEFRTFLIETNLTLAFFNLLPGLPLDGGRILRAAISTRLGFLRATEVASSMAFYLSLVMVAISISSLWLGVVNLGMTTLGFFLFFSAWELRKQRQYDLIRFLDAKRRQMQRGVMQNRTLMAHPELTLETVAAEFVPDAYHMVSVYNEKRSAWYTFTEDEILHVMFEGTGPKTQIMYLIQD